MKPWEVDYASASDVKPWEVKYAAPSKPATMPQLSTSETIIDVAKALPTGVVKGAMGLATLPGNLEAAGTAGLDWVLEKLGKPGFGKAMQSFNTATDSTPYTAVDLQKDAEHATGITLPKPQTTAGKYAQTIGEFAPAAIGGAPSVAGKLLNVAAPAVASEAAGQMAEGSGAEGAARMIGALGGAFLPGLAARAVTPHPVSPARNQNVAVLDAEGIPLTAGERTGSQRLRYAESTTEHTPFGGSAYADIKQQQGDAFTGAVLRRGGENATRATPDVLDGAFTRIGQTFDDLAQRNTLRFDQPFVADVTKAVNEYRYLVPPISGQKTVIDNVLHDIQNLAQRTGGTMAGDAYQAMRSRLDKAARASRNDPQLSDALFGIRNALDNAMERAIGVTNPADLGAWRNVRNEYRNMLVIEKAATGAGENAANGIISPAQLRNAVVQQNRRAYARGDGDFAELARAGEAVLKPMPQSGTAPRLNATATMSALGAGGGALAAGAPGAMMGSLASIAAPAIGSRMLMSRPVQNWLSNQTLAPQINANALARPSALTQSGAAAEDMIPEDVLAAVMARLKTARPSFFGAN